MLTWSHQITRLAEQLRADEELPDRNSQVYEEHRRVIQNNMDAARYLGPQLQNFSQFVLPIGSYFLYLYSFHPKKQLMHLKILPFLYFFAHRGNLNIN